MSQLSARGVMYDVIVPQSVIAKGLDLDGNNASYSNLNFYTDSAVTMAVLQQVPKFLYRTGLNPRQREKALEETLLSFALGSRHQVPMVLSYVLYNLCLHPEYVQPLRDEIIQVGEKGFESAQNNEMPYLDSFLKEVARTNPLTDVAIPRKVMSPFTFDDGTHVPIGNYFCVPHAPIMNNPAFYPDPETSDGFRFVSKDICTSISRLSHTSAESPFWGSVKQGCPARFFVSLALKMIIVHFLNTYDFNQFKRRH
ncbi:hypothetical protein EYC80_005587 [Monilinia laxa]|uniref:Cytochrome P450 n=1 Tax=Monilinia laxa TaxID=61186 RepID=A0A5N6KFQ6_MONLA|nr:hypothetical protein EYC80_005587 [Monilinia laxa]